MKTIPTAPPHRRGFTLLELSLVIGVLIALIGISMYSTRSLKEWRLGRDASEKLRAAYVAQRNYLADNPTTQVSTLTPALIRPYLPKNFDDPNQGNNPFTNKKLLAATSLTGTTLYIRVNVSPPYVTTNSNGTSGSPYDPSGSETDSLWDVGQ